VGPQALIIPKTATGGGAAATGSRCTRRTRRPTRWTAAAELILSLSLARPPTPRWPGSSGRSDFYRRIGLACRTREPC